MVNASSPQASAAGLEMLRKGGNAVDAAIATAAALTVVEPTANGLGGDAFALVWMNGEGKLHGLNSSGPAPKGISIQKVLESGQDDHGKMPSLGWTPVTVPGIPKAWAELSRRFGRLPLSQVVAPAIRYAREGYPCSPNLAKFWKRGLEKYRAKLPDTLFEEWFRTFCPLGRAYEAGEIIRLPDHGDTIEAIGETGADAYYHGHLADKIDAASRAGGGYLRKEDLEAYEARWVEPISVDYRGYRVWEIPPNGQGLVALIGLNILKEFQFHEKDCADTYHKQWEAMKMAFADGLHYITDPGEMAIDYHRFLLPEYGRIRAEQITGCAMDRKAQEPPAGGTVYLCAADGEGNMISYIQSNYSGFGSGVVIPGTGIAMQNRGSDFSLDPAAANCLKGGKRSYHTIIPGFITKGDQAVGPFGVMGAYMQPQGHLQVAMNLIDFGLDPQQALDAPRWRWLRGNEFEVETGFHMEIARQLLERGHKVSVQLDTASFGRGQMIVRLENGVLVGGTESRTDSNIACF